VLLWARDVVSIYDDCAARLDQVIEAWPKETPK
jgi:hypothetical protein